MQLDDDNRMCRCAHKAQRHNVLIDGIVQSRECLEASCRCIGFAPFAGPDRPGDRQRATWDKARLAMARELAKRSLCARDQVGAIITDAENRIVAEGYNGPPADFPHGNQPCTSWCPRSTAHTKRDGLILPGDLKTDYSDCPSLHAEANALMMSDRAQRRGGSIYVTSFPCTGCIKLISNSGLKRLVIGVDGKHEYRFKMENYNILPLIGINVVFEDNRDMPLFMEPKAASWFGKTPQDYIKGCITPESHHHQRNFNGVCVHGCDPNSTNCD